MNLKQQQNNRHINRINDSEDLEKIIKHIFNVIVKNDFNQPVDLLKYSYEKCLLHTDSLMKAGDLFYNNEKGDS